MKSSFDTKILEAIICPYLNISSTPAHMYIELEILILESCHCSQQQPDYKNMLIEGENN